MASTPSSATSSSLRLAARSAAEGAALALGSGLLLVLAFGRESAGPLSLGLGLAWAVSSASVAALLVARERGVEAFWWAFGAGTALRALGLAALMARVWDQPAAAQGATLAPYALGVLGLLLLEYRHLGNG